MPAYRAVAALRLGELHARQGSLQAAEENLKAKLLRPAPQDLRAAEELIAVMRAQGKEEQRRQLAARVAGAISIK